MTGVVEPGSTQEYDPTCPVHGALRAGVEALRATVARVEALLPDEDDPYVHVHTLPGGEPDCGGCWDADIRKALRGDES